MARAMVASNKATSSCTSCYRRKLRCDRTITGCTTCTRSQLPCMYEPHAKAHHSRPKVRTKTGKRGPYKKHATPREKELEHIVQILQSRIKDSVARESAETQASSGGPRTSALLSPPRVSNLGNSTGCTPAADDALEGDCELGFGGPLEAGSTSQGTYEIPAPVFIEAAMLESMESMPSISQSNVLQLWHVFIHRVEPMAKLVHIPSFAPVMIAAAGNFGWVPHRSARLLVASVLFASTSILSDEEINSQLKLNKCILTRSLRSQLDVGFGDSAVSADPSLFSLQALCLFIVVLRSRGDDQGVSSLVQLARGMARNIASSQTVFVAEMQRRCWWTLNRMQSRCAEESQASATGSRYWEDYAMPSNLNDYDLDPMSQVEPRPRPGITDSSLLIIRLEFVRLIESINQALTSGLPLHAVAQCRVLLTEKLQLLHREYLQYTHESRQRDRFLVLTYEVLKAKVNMMILRQEIIGSSYDSCTDVSNDDMDDAALTMLESSQILLTNPIFTPWSWCYTRSQQSYTMAYLLSSLIHRQSPKHADRARAFLAGLCWESWLDGLRSDEHRSILARLYQQVQGLEQGDLTSYQAELAMNAGSEACDNEIEAGASLFNGMMTQTSSSSLSGISADFPRLEDVCPLADVGLSTSEFI